MMVWTTAGIGVGSQGGAKDDSLSRTLAAEVLHNPDDDGHHRRSRAWWPSLVPPHSNAHPRNRLPITGAEHTLTLSPDHAGAGGARDGQAVQGILREVRRRADERGRGVVQSSGCDLSGRAA